MKSQVIDGRQLNKHHINLNDFYLERRSDNYYLITLSAVSVVTMYRMVVAVCGGSCSTRWGCVVQTILGISSARFVEIAHRQHDGMSIVVSVARFVVATVLNVLKHCSTFCRSTSWKTLPTHKFIR